MIGSLLSPAGAMFNHACNPYPATSALELNPPLPHLHRDWAGLGCRQPERHQARRADRRSRRVRRAERHRRRRRGPPPRPFAMSARPNRRGRDSRTDAHGALWHGLSAAARHRPVGHRSRRPRWPRPLLEPPPFAPRLRGRAGHARAAVRPTSRRPTGSGAGALARRRASRTRPSTRPPPRAAARCATRGTSSARARGARPAARRRVPTETPTATPTTMASRRSRRTSWRPTAGSARRTWRARFGNAACRRRHGSPERATWAPAAAGG